MGVPLFMEDGSGRSRLLQDHSDTLDLAMKNLTRFKAQDALILPSAVTNIPTTPSYPMIETIDTHMTQRFKRTITIRSGFRQVRQHCPSEMNDSELDRP